MAVMTIQFFSNSLRREVNLQAILPIDSFNTTTETSINANTPFKSLYLFHGFHGSSTDWLHNSNIREIAAQQNIAVFMPNLENHFCVDDVEKGELYGQFFGEELVAITRAMFPLSTKREDTIIAGLSMGGYGALRTAYNYPQQFGKIIAMSSAIVTYHLVKEEPENREGIVPDSYFPRVFGQQVKGSSNDLEAVISRLIESGSELPDLYLCCGNQDFVLELNQKLHNFLQEKQVKHIYAQTEGAHDWHYWREHIQLGLEWALATEK